MTVMEAMQELEPPRSSTTVSVTGVTPRAYGPAGLRVRLTIDPSGSKEPLSTCAAVTLAWHEEFEDAKG